MTKIGYRAFYGCKELSYINIPNSVDYIGGFAFLGTKWFEHLPNGLIYINNLLYSYKGHIDNNPLSIKDGVKTICDLAFVDRQDLTSIKLPKSVVEIGQATFYNCKELTSIIIPNSVTEIARSTFKGCQGLTSITIPNSVRKIGSRAFSNCSGFTSVDIPNSVTEIAESAFEGCTGLTSVDIPNSVTAIGRHAFYNNNSLQKIRIPSSVSFIGEQSLSNYSLASIIVDDDNPVYYSLHGILFKRMEKGDNLLVIYPPKKSGNRFVVDEHTVMLESYAFQNAQELEEIILHDNIISLGQHDTFVSCSKLKEIRLPSNCKEIPDRAFADCSSLKEIFLPNSESYIINYEAFKGCKNIKSIHSSVENIDNIIILDDEEIGLSVFNDLIVDECTLYVPVGTLSAYRHHPGFSKFKNIEIETNQKE